MREYKVGDRVRLTKLALSVSYIAGRHFYTNMYEGKTGTILGYTETHGKVGVQFDDIVFTGERKSSHDNGCHGKGKLHYCWYIPSDEHFLELISSVDEDELLLLLL